MNSTIQNDGVAKFDAEMTFRLPSMAISAVSTKDVGQVRLGGFGPAFRVASLSDAGTVRVGGFGPAFRVPALSDAGAVRVGGFGPLFR